MSPSPRALAVAMAIAVSLLFVPLWAGLAAAVVLVGAVAADAAAARRRGAVVRRVPEVLARGVPAALTVTVEPAGASHTRVRQPIVPDVVVSQAEGDDGLEATISATRRGHHVLPPVAVRATGPLGLARWDTEAAGPADLRVFPDLPAAHRLATAVRRGRFREPGQRVRGPLGRGTEFESVRDYSPDDDVRQVNWVATARVERPMSNQFREDTERDVVGLVDCGRLMAAPVDGRTRLDAALDALAALAAVSDVVGDRCGAVAFDDRVRRRISPARANAGPLVRALHEVEPVSVDSDYDAAFAAVGRKRSLVVVFTDLLEEAASRPLLDAVPALARRHAVLVVTASDPDLRAFTTTVPSTVAEVLAAGIAGEVLDARDRVVARLSGFGVTVVDAEPDVLAAATVAAYLRLKSTARV